MTYLTTMIVVTSEVAVLSRFPLRYDHLVKPKLGRNSQEAYPGRNQTPTLDMSQDALWIGLVELKPLDPRIYGAAGAFTNILTWACNSEGFRRKADVIAATLDMYVTEVEGAEPLMERMQRADLTEELDEMLLRAQSNPSAIIYGTFHRYSFQ